MKKPALITRLYSACANSPPRHHSGFTENLSAYRQNAEEKFTRQYISYLDNEEIAFDIERKTSTKRQPTYSIMIDTFIPLNKAISAKEFQEHMSSIDGFILEKDQGDRLDYLNAQKNIFVNRIIQKREGRFFSKKYVCFGVIQKTPVDNLAEVIQMIPYFVTINNQLNPKYILKSEVVNESIKLVLEQDKFLFGKRR
jgi:hypothetical protein